MSWNQILSRVVRIAAGALQRSLEQPAQPGPKQGGTRGRTVPGGGSEAAAGKRQYPGATPRPHGNNTHSWDVHAVPVPQFSYAPEGDGDADPGEVVWTWVPYDEDDSVGKDRPVVVLGRQGQRLVCAQMTSKNHTGTATIGADQGRWWFAIGSGPWDTSGRSSEVRIDRLLDVPSADVRREGAALDYATFERLNRAIHNHVAGV